MTRDGILRERLADTLTDALRASILRLVGYRVEVVEFVDSKHTPRNTLLRAVRTGAEPRERAREEYETLTTTWCAASRPRRAARPGRRPVIHRLLLVGVLLGGIAVPAAAAATTTADDDGAPPRVRAPATTGSSSPAGWPTWVR